MGVMICLHPTNTDVDTVLTLFPLSFRSAMMGLISEGIIGDMKQDC